MITSEVFLRSIFVLLAFAALTPDFSKAETARVIKIGVLTDLTGKASQQGQQTRIATELLNQELIAQGKKVEFVLGDHGLDTARAVTEAQKLLNVDKVDAVFSNFSGTSRAVSPLVKNANRLFVYTAAALEPVKNNPSAFKGYLDYARGCQKIASEWKKQGSKVIAVLKAEAEYGELCLEGTKREFPEAIVASYKAGEDVSSQILSLKSKNVEGILNTGYDGDMGNMLKAIRQIRFRVKIGANEDIFTEKLNAEYPQELAQATSFGMPHLAKDFVEKLKAIDAKQITGEPSQAGMSYLHLRQLVSVLSKCQVQDLNCAVAEMTQAASDPHFGFLRFSDGRQAEYDWALRNFQNGKFTETH